MTDLYDFGDGAGPVLARRHPNGGGWVAKTARVTTTAYVGLNAKVYGNAHVQANARIYGHARVYGDALVLSGANVYEHARVFGSAWVHSGAKVHGYASVRGDMQVSGDVGGLMNIRRFIIFLTALALVLGVSLWCFDYCDRHRWVDPLADSDDIICGRMPVAGPDYLSCKNPETGEWEDYLPKTPLPDWASHCREEVRRDGNICYKPGSR